MNFKKYIELVTESNVQKDEDDNVELTINAEMADMTDEQIEEILASDSVFIDEDEELELEFDCELDDEEDTIPLKERVTKTKVVRDGKKVIKFKSDKPGYKIVRDEESGKAKEIKMTPAEIKTRKIAAKKGAKKSKSKRNLAAVKRAKSNKMK